MTILDKAQIGNTVKVNIEQSKDRLDKEIIDTLKIHLSELFVILELLMVKE